MQMNICVKVSCVSRPNKMNAKNQPRKPDKKNSIFKKNMYFCYIYTYRYTVHQINVRTCTNKLITFEVSIFDYFPNFIHTFKELNNIKFICPH